MCFQRGPHCCAHGKLAMGSSPPLPPPGNRKSSLPGSSNCREPRYTAKMPLEAGRAPWLTDIITICVVVNKKTEKVQKMFRVVIAQREKQKLFTYLKKSPKDQDGDTGRTSSCLPASSFVGLSSYSQMSPTVLPQVGLWVSPRQTSPSQFQVVIFSIPSHTRAPVI